jgi:hypothetical protein
VADILAKLTPTPVVRVVELPDLPAGGDIVDWINVHGDAAEPDRMRAEIEALAQEVKPWRSENADDLTFRPFPVDALPEPIRGFVDAGARAIGCDLPYLALPLLTAIAAAIGNARRLELKRGWSAPPILWGGHRWRERYGQNAGFPAGHAARPRTAAESPGSLHRTDEAA